MFVKNNLYLYIQESGTCLIILLFYCKIRWLKCHQSALTPFCHADKKAETSVLHAFCRHDL